MNIKSISVIVLLVVFTFSLQAGNVTGELMLWHKVTVTFDGPETSEIGKVNPFTDYRLNVMFQNGNKKAIVPGYYAADGNAAQTSAETGSKWRVHFIPNETGKWTYKASFRTGKDIALSLDPLAGKMAGFDGAEGSFVIEKTDKTGKDFRAKGFLRLTEKGYLRHAGTGEYYLKIGADSPENMLGYEDFDGTYDTDGLNREGEAKGGVFIHKYKQHVKHWIKGDPTWKDGKGKGLIGGLNYLASKGVNSVYFITYNIDGGDGKDVWPWLDPKEKFRFDCSKLDQWEIVFCHMDKLGIMLHNISQEQENDQGLDKGELGRERKLYYRELIARFGHHLGITWNLGEENTNTTAQQKACAKYFHDLDPYDHPVVVHTFPDWQDRVYTPLLGYKYLQGASIQTEQSHEKVKQWVLKSTDAGQRWYVCLDEIGPAHTGVKPDKDDPSHDETRKRHLWGAMMAGSAGTEWYFGYKFAHNDLNCEDWSSRDLWWDQVRIAVEFFQDNLPFYEMLPADELVGKGNYCFAKYKEIYAIYLPNGGTTAIDLGNDNKTYKVKWFNPRTGGALQFGTVTTIKGPGKHSIGLSPLETDKDWAILIKP